MNTIQYLEDQAARAERLAKRITDTLTIEKLLAFADERRESGALPAICSASTTTMRGQVWLSTKSLR